MAFPTIQTADTKSGTVTSNSSSWTATYPTNIASGDLLLLFVGADGSTGVVNSLPAGWVLDGTTSGANSLSWAKKKAGGTETGDFTIGLGASEQGGWRVFRITGWEGTLGTVFANGSTSEAVVEASTITGSPSNAPNPPSLDPNNWATEDTLWFAACGIDTSRTISVYPLADNNTADVSGGSNGATLGVCTTTSAVSSLDPGTFTCSASDDWVASTIAVRPAAAVTDFDTRSRMMRPTHPQAVQRAANWMKRHSGIFVPREKLWLPEGAVI